MKIEEAILYCLASQNRGMRTEQIAEMINRQRLHPYIIGKPVDRGHSSRASAKTRDALKVVPL